MENCSRSARARPLTKRAPAISGEMRGCVPLSSPGPAVELQEAAKTGEHTTEGEVVLGIAGTMPHLCGVFGVVNLSCELDALCDCENEKDPPRVAGLIMSPIGGCQASRS